MLRVKQWSARAVHLQNSHTDHARKMIGDNGLAPFFGPPNDQRYPTYTFVFCVIVAMTVRGVGIPLLQ